MPKGVEHGRFAGGIVVWQGVRTSVMPKGVEHNLHGESPLSALSENLCDAERR